MSVRSAIVTGPSSGIGRAISIRLAADGFDVLLADIRRDPITGGEPTEDVIRRRGERHPHRRGRLRPRPTAKRLVAAAVERTGALDLVVNNAVLAGDHSKPLLDTEPADWDAMMAVNLRGPYLLCRAAVRQMLTQPLVGDARGRIVNITSQHGMVGCPGHFTYSVGKGGLIQMTRQIAVDYGPQGILCNAVAPGKIVTGTPGDLSAEEAGAGVRAVADAVPAARPVRGRRRGRCVPGQRGELRQRDEPDGRRRLDGLLMAATERFFWLRDGLEIADGRLVIAGRDAERLARDARHAALRLRPRPDRGQGARPAGDAGRRRAATPWCASRSRPTTIPTCWRWSATWAPASTPARRARSSWRCEEGFSPGAISFTGTNLSERDLDVLLRPACT